MQTETNNVRATPVHPSVESALSQLFEVALDEPDAVTQRSGEQAKDAGKSRDGGAKAPGTSDKAE